MDADLGAKIVTARYDVSIEKLNPNQNSTVD